MYFKIEDIRLGCFTAIFGDQTFYATNNNIFDPAYLLIKAICDLLENKVSETENIWDDMEEEHCLWFGRTDDILLVNLVKSDGSKEPNTNIFTFADRIIWEFELYENGNGRQRYDKHWLPFPQQEYDRLKKLIKEK